MPKSHVGPAQRAKSAKIARPIEAESLGELCRIIRHLGSGILSILITARSYHFVIAVWRAKEAGATFREPLQAINLD